MTRPIFIPGSTRTLRQNYQRGHQKQHRWDLKSVVLALMVTTDFNIPLFHAVYPGNRNDATEFQSITDELLAHRTA